MLHFSEEKKKEEIVKFYGDQCKSYELVIKNCQLKNIEQQMECYKKLYRVSHLYEWFITETSAMADIWNTFCKNASFELEL